MNRMFHISLCILMPLCGCSSIKYSSSQEDCDRYTGKPVETVATVLGSPDEATEFESGKFYTWYVWSAPRALDQGYVRFSST